MFRLLETKKRQLFIPNGLALLPNVFCHPTARSLRFLAARAHRVRAFVQLSKSRLLELTEYFKFVEVDTGIRVEHGVGSRVLCGIRERST